MVLPHSNNQAATDNPFFYCKVLHSDNESLAHFIAETNAAFVAELVKKHSFTHVVAVADAKGKSIVPRAASLINVGALTDVSGIVSEDTFTRPIYAGNAIATVQSSDKVKLITIRPTSFEKANADTGKATLEKVAPTAAPAKRATWKSEALTVSERPALQGANIVISGGR
jgi:electron transfer flavoprotein alpha subunit